MSAALRSAFLLIMLPSAVAWSAEQERAASPLAVVVAPPVTGNVILFPDELSQLHEAAQRYLVRQRVVPLMPVPMKQVRAIEELVATRKLSAGGPTCMVGPSFREIAKQRFPGAARATVSVDHGCRERGRHGGGGLAAALELASPGADPRHCDKVFKLGLRVIVARESGSYETLLAQSAEVSGPTELSSWIAAFDRLGPPNNRTMGLLASAGSPPPGVLVDITDARVAGEWGELRGFHAWEREADGDAFGMELRGLARPEDTLPSRKKKRSLRGLVGLLDKASTALNACHVEGRFFLEQALLSVDPRGAVKRCHIESEALGVPATHLRCVCSALSTVSFRRAKGPRRLSLSLNNRYGSPEQRASSVSVYAVRPTRDDPFEVQSSIEVAVQQLRHVLRREKIEQVLILPVTLTVGPTGAVQRVDIERLELIDASRHPEMKRAFEGAPFPCPQLGKETEVRLELRIDQVREHKGLNSLFGD